MQKLIIVRLPGLLYEHVHIIVCVSDYYANLLAIYVTLTDGKYAKVTSKQSSMSKQSQGRSDLEEGNERGIFAAQGLGKVLAGREATQASLVGCDAHAATSLKKLFLTFGPGHKGCRGWPQHLHHTLHLLCLILTWQSTASIPTTTCQICHSASIGFVMVDLVGPRTTWWKANPLPYMDASKVAVEGISMNHTMPRHSPLGYVSQHVTAADHMHLNSHLSSSSKACTLHHTTKQMCAKQCLKTQKLQIQREQAIASGSKVWMQV